MRQTIMGEDICGMHQTSSFSSIITGVPKLQLKKNTREESFDGLTAEYFATAAAAD